MSTSIEALAVSVKGQVTRRTGDGRTTFVLSEDQARELHEALGPVLDFFANQQK